MSYAVPKIRICAPAHEGFRAATFPTAISQRSTATTCDFLQMPLRLLQAWKHQLQEYSCNFEVGLREVLVNSRYISHWRFQSCLPLKEGKATCTEAELYIAANGYIRFTELNKFQKENTQKQMLVYIYSMQKLNRCHGQI